MNIPIVITSIASPTSAVIAFSEIENVHVIVIGDKKSPSKFECNNTSFLSVENQKQLSYEIVKFLPYNHYCRKMIGYLEAISRGAQVIYETDDDNLPYADWHIESFEGIWDTTPTNRGFLNLYKSFTSQHIWPRGFDLMTILEPTSVLQNEELTKSAVKVGIWQGLADGDPDVDAIYRLTNNVPCTFNKREPIVLAQGSICPFNSQNTAFMRDVFALLYLPAFVTFRFTDILRGLIAQPILWAKGYHLGFTQSTVFQERNPHNYLKDFESEIPCYLHSKKVIEIVSGVVSSDFSMSDNLHRAYHQLLQENIVQPEEMTLLDAWLKDISQVMK